MPDLSVGDYGIPIQIALTWQGVAYDPSQDSVIFTFRAANGVETRKVASAEMVDGQIIAVYTIERGLLASPGRWDLLVEIESPATNPTKHLSGLTTFPVKSKWTE